MLRQSLRLQPGLVRGIQTCNYIGFTNSALGSEKFQSFFPATAETPEHEFTTATQAEVDDACKKALGAFAEYRQVSSENRAVFLDTIAAEIEAASAEGSLPKYAHGESGLPEARIAGETGRTVGQLRKFAAVLREGSWVEARVDFGEGTICDLRRMLVPLGPVAVFGASNFPLAFSTAGGDTASALAAGCPVVMNAHTAHPVTSSIVASCINSAAKKTGMPDGVFSLLHGRCGLDLVKHDAIAAVGFTGSQTGGRLFMDTAAARARPIPVYAEMASINPVFLLPEAIKTQSSAIAEGLAGSITLGAGQFCTNPGLVFARAGSDTDKFLAELGANISKTPAQTMLTRDILSNYNHAVARLASQPNVVKVAEGAAGDASNTSGGAFVFSTTVEEFLSNPVLSDEVFGSTSLVVQYTSDEQLKQAVEAMEGQLTASIHGSDEELLAHKWLYELLSVEKVGRLVTGGYPTGVDVTHAMTHGGPYPSTSDGRTTSVGQEAIKRFVRATSYQDTPDSLLPRELQRANPCNILRFVNREWTSAAE